MRQVQVWSIGIGGRVASPPLPHHRTCGSACSQCGPFGLCLYAAFFLCRALTRAHLALAAATILFRPSGDKIRLAPEALATDEIFELLRTFAHLALCAWAIRLLAAADMILFGREPLV